MAIKAIFYFGRKKFPTNRFVYCVWCEYIVTDCGVETGDVRIVTDEAFIPLSIALKNPGLHADPEIPMNGQCDGLLAIRNAVCALVALGLDGIGEAALLNCQFRMSF